MVEVSLITLKLVLTTFRSGSKRGHSADGVWWSLIIPCHWVSRLLEGGCSLGSDLHMHSHLWALGKNVSVWLWPLSTISPFLRNSPLDDHKKEGNNFNLGLAAEEFEFDRCSTWSKSGLMMQVCRRSITIYYRDPMTTTLNVANFYCLNWWWSGSRPSPLPYGVKQGAWLAFRRFAWSLGWRTA